MVLAAALLLVWVANSLSGCAMQSGPCETTITAHTRCEEGGSRVIIFPLPVPVTP